MRFTICLALTYVFSSGCAALQQYDLPMTAEQLARYDSGRALVAYLGQGEADIGVCNLRGQTPHLSVLTHAEAETLVAGLVDKSLSAGRWHACAEALLASAGAAGSRELLDVMGDGYRDLIRARNFERDDDPQERLQVLQQLYLERDAAQNPDPAVADDLFKELREAIATLQLGPVAARFGSQLLAAHELERDQWHGQAVDEASIAQLADEPTLRLFEARLRSDTLRQAARKQIVHLHVAASHDPRVLAQPQAVEAKLLELGANSVELDARAIEAMQLAEPALWRTVFVHQDVRGQSASLKGRAADGAHWFTDMPLRSRLRVQLRDSSAPITLCAPAKELDPAPCVPARELSVDNPLVSIDAEGVLHLADHLALDHALGLVDTRAHFLVQLQIHGAPGVTFDWPLHFQRPDSLVMLGHRPGEHGPALDLTVKCLDDNLFLFTLQTSELHGSVLVEAGDLPQFFVVSQGAFGRDGSDGESGTRGEDGRECGDGKDGGKGHPGHDGGPGADGGDVHVHVQCEEPAPLKILIKTVTSAGGSGGRAGRGGAGGLGGAAGPGRDGSTQHDANGHTKSTHGCAPGERGDDGPPGVDGIAGPPGAPGHVFFD